MRSDRPSPVRLDSILHGYWSCIGYHPMNEERMMELMQLQYPSLVPELPLYMGTRMVELWRTLGTQAPPYWAFAWVGGQALARYTLDFYSEFQGKTVLDFGPGTGINSIAAAVRGAYVTAVDNMSESQMLTGINAGFHNVTNRVITANELIDADGNDTDILLLGDVYYEKDVADACNEVADKVLAAGGRVLCGDPMREFFPRRRATKLASYTVNDQLNLERRPSVPAYVWELVRG